MKHKTFETERLLLSPTSKMDAEFVLELLNTPKWVQFIGERNIRNIKDAEEYIGAKMVPQLERLGYSNYTITRKSDGAKMGSCGLYDREGLDGIDIGFAFLPKYEKQGYAFEAANKLKEMAKDEFHLKKLCAITSKNNFSSQRLLEKLGLKPTDVVRLSNEEEELFLYNIAF